MALLFLAANLRRSGATAGRKRSWAKCLSQHTPRPPLVPAPPTGCRVDDVVITALLSHLPRQQGTGRVPASLLRRRAGAHHCRIFAVCLLRLRGSEACSGCTNVPTAQPPRFCLQRGTAWAPTRRGSRWLPCSACSGWRERPWWPKRWGCCGMVCCCKGRSVQQSRAWGRARGANLSMALFPRMRRPARVSMRQPWWPRHRCASCPGICGELHWKDGLKAPPPHACMHPPRAAARQRHCGHVPDRRGGRRGRPHLCRPAVGP